MNVRLYCTEYYLPLDTKKLNTLNDIRALPIGVLFDLCACNFMHVKISLHACCVHGRHCMHNLSSRGKPSIAMVLLLLLTFLSSLLCILVTL